MPNGLPAPRDHRISVPAAATQTRRSQSHRPKGAIKAHAFPKNAILEVLDQRQAVWGMRIYYGMNEDGEDTLILVAVDHEFNDILHVPGAQLQDGEDGDAVLMEFSFPCPIYCGGGNALNGGDD